MRDGLAREFPGAVRALTWTRNPMFRREPLLWATLSAIGAGFLVTTFAQFLVRLGFFMFDAFGGRASPFTLAWLPLLLGTAAAVAVTLRAGGALSLVLYLGFLALETTLQIPGVLTFCERSGFVSPLAPDMCTPLGFVASHWAQFTGIGLGLLLSRTITAPIDGRNLTLRVAGTYALLWSLAVRVWSLAVIQTADPPGALNASLTMSGLAIAAALAAGVVAAQSEHRVRTALVVAVFLIVPWLTSQVPLFISQSSMPPTEFLPAMIVGALIQPAAAVVLVLAAVVADRERFIPRDTA